MSKIAVIGFGNPISNDVAVGCYVIDELTAYYMFSPWVTLFDMGNSDSTMLSKLEGHDHIILVDTVMNSGEPAGTIFKLPVSRVTAASLNGEKHKLNGSKPKLNGLKWDQALIQVKNVLNGQFPDRVEVYLVAVDNGNPDAEMSEAVESAGNELVKRIRRTVAENGI